MKVGKIALLFLVLVAAVVVWDGFYILPEGQQAVVTQLGAPVGEPVTSAGPHFKMPVLQKVRYLEKRILIWDGKPNQVPTHDKTFIYIDTTARWRISDAMVFMQAVRNYAGAQAVLDDIIDSSVRDIVNKNNLVEIIRSSDWDVALVGDKGADFPEIVELGRDKIAERIFLNAGEVTPKYGIELVDVMFKRVNYIDSVRSKVYGRMISERQRIAAEKRSVGEGQKSEILGKLERELKDITSGARRESAEIKGRADATAAKIYADAYSKDPEFYSFSKSLQSYEKIVDANTKFIISSDSEFYKYFDKQ
ncbi:MAG: protease modulator HflC [Desulfurivibrionaceae bacterium]|nr:protease modulator HflC [Desulfurivibrionaceae bacterium]